MEQLRGSMAAGDLETLRRDILDRAVEGARASGGLLGFGERVSPAERAVLEEIEHIFREPG